MNINTSVNLFGKLQDNGFKIVGKYIHKRSETNNKFKVVGQVNENNLFFYSENVYPFKGGVNFLNEDNSGENKKDLQEYYTKVKENDRNDFNVSYQDYHKTTKENSIFLTWLDTTKRTYLSKLSENYFDTRGIVNGYLEDAVCFPFFDYENNFITAQIIKYGNDGKRIKTQFSANWYHSYKPIKTELGFKDKDNFSVSIPCFFGENYLNGSDNIVAIVEAPKTAVILKEIYPNIDWIATAGEQTLFNKNLDVLKDKKIILFPDAKTTKWRDFAKEQGFYCSDILEHTSVAPGDDLADYVFNAESEIYSSLHEHLFALNLGEFDFEICKDSIKLDYKITGHNTNYFITVPTYYKGHKVLNQLDNSKDLIASFKGKKFDLYSKTYDLYIAQIDWHRPILRNKQLVKPTEKDFLFNLQQCFRILKELNPKIYKGLFNEVVKRFRDSNFTFNERYVLNRLVPFWDSWNRDLDVFKISRHWKYKGGASLSREDFMSELNNHRFQYKLKIRLQNLYDVVDENRFIDIQSDLGIYKEKGYFKLKEIVRNWNENIIGCKTLKSSFNKNSFFTKLNMSTKSDALYISNTICSASSFVPNIKYKEISEITGVKNKNTIKSFVTFKADEVIRNSIFDEVYHLLNNVNDITPIRQRIGNTTRIQDFEIIERKTENSDALDHCLSLAEAFPTLDQLNEIEIDPLSEKQIEVFNYEYSYLSLLEELQTYSWSFKKELLNDSTERSKFLYKYANYKKYKPIIANKSALQIA